MPKQYRITISEAEVNGKKPNMFFNVGGGGSREKDIFQYLVMEDDINIKRVLQTIVEPPERREP